METIAAPPSTSAQSNSLNERESIYQPEQEGLIFPQLPQFKSIAEERQHRKERLVAGCRAFAMHGFDYGMAGHISVRDPEHPNLYWTNPMAVHFSQVKISNLILADHEGRVVEGKHAINRAGFVVHASVHEAHPDIVAMCHAHTPHGTAWCSTGRRIEPFNQDAACFYDNHTVVSSATKPPLMDDSAARHSATHVGSDYLGWLHFQPVYDQVVAANPDMFD